MRVVDTTERVYGIFAYYRVLMLTTRSVNIERVGLNSLVPSARVMAINSA